MEPMMLNSALKALFEKKLQKMNRKAVKLGMTPVSVSFGATVHEKASRDTVGAVHEGGGKYTAMYTEVFIHGDAPVIAGYRLIAVVDLRGEKPVVRKTPHASDVDMAPFHDTDSTCEHCNTRRQRNDVLVMQEVSTGKVMQIGRNCAADFFGTKDATSRLSVCDWIDTFERDYDGENLPRSEITVGVRHLFTVAAAVVRAHGWMNHKDCYEGDGRVSTKARVWGNLFPYSAAERAAVVPLLDVDYEEADVVMAWLEAKFLSKADSDCSDFERNIKAVVESADTVPHIRMANLNYLIWCIAGYKRDLQKDADDRRREAERNKQAASSEYVGVPGEREVFTLTLKFKRAFSGDYGPRYLQKFEDGEGNVVVWWGTNATSEGTIVGNSYVLKATVKEHVLYEGVKQTMLTRGTMLDGVLEELED